MGFFKKLGNLPGAYWGAAANLAGSILGANAQRDATREANAANERIARENADMQREFAQHGMRWRLEDAQRAGIHPLAALGSSGASFSGSQPYAIGDTSRADMFRNMGQDFSRAVQATQTRQERLMGELQLERARLENKLLESQILGTNRSQIGPGFPSTDNFNPVAGQGDSPLVLQKPLTRTISAPGRPAQEAGWRPDVSYSRTDTGLTPVIPESLTESLEDDLVGQILWRIRNQIMPNFGTSRPPPKHMLPKGYNHWSWSMRRQEWTPVKRMRSTGEKFYDRFFGERIGDMYRKFQRKRK